MTYSGRMLLLRVELHCSEQWGEAYARMDQPGVTIDIRGKPFEVDSWRDAITIVNYLRRGVSLPKRLTRREGNNGKSFKANR